MISVIIPCLSERGDLQITLTKLLPERNGHEVIVVQEEPTADLRVRYPWVKAIQADGTRSAQVNAGVGEASGDILFVLLPGTQPERGWAKAISDCVGKGGEAGSFRVAYPDSDCGLLCLAAGLNLRATGMGMPDLRNGLFLKKELFDRFGGWMEHDVGYDLEFVSRLRDHGVKWQRLSGTMLNPRNSGTRKGTLWQLATSWKLARAVSRRASQEEMRTIAAHQQRAVLFWYEHTGPRSPAAQVATHIKGDLTTAQRLVEPWLLYLIELTEGRGLRADAYLCVDPKTAREPVIHRMEKQCPVIHLKDGRVGDRVAQTLEAAFAKGYLRAVTVNPQCPDLNQAYLDEAFNKLDLYDVVVGPTRDGGVHLLACKPGDADVFREIEWRGSLLEVVLDTCRGKGLRVHTLDPLTSLNEEDAWRSAWNRGFLQAS